MRRQMTLALCGLVSPQQLHHYYYYYCDRVLQTQDSTTKVL